MLSSSRVTLPLQAVFQGVGEKRGGEAHSVTAMLEWVRLYVLQYSFHLRNLRLTLSTGFSHACLGTPALSHQQTQWEMLARTSVSPYQGLNFCSHFRHITRTTWWWGWTLSSHSIENTGEQQNENSVSKEKTCYYKQDRNKPVHKWVPRPSGFSELTWSLPAHPVLDKTTSYIHFWPQRASPTPRQVSYDWRRGEKSPTPPAGENRQ